MYNLDYNPTPTKPYRGPRPPVCEDFSPWNCAPPQSKSSISIGALFAKLIKLARPQRVEK